MNRLLPVAGPAPMSAISMHLPLATRRRPASETLGLGWTGQSAPESPLCRDNGPSPPSLAATGTDQRADPMDTRIFDRVNARRGLPGARGGGWLGGEKRSLS